MRLRHLAALALLFGLAGRAEAQATHTITDLGALPGADTIRGTAVSDSGYVAGESEITGFGLYHAFRWFNGTLQDLGTLGGNYSRGHGVNNAGWVVGEARNKQGQVRAFLHDGTRMTDLLGKIPGNPGSAAYGINNSNRVVGDLGGRPFTWKAGVRTYLPGLTGSTGSGHADAVNDSDLIVGWAPNAAGLIRAVTWQNGVITELPLPPGGFTQSHAYSVNNNGVVAGRAYAVDQQDAMPVLWTNGIPQVLSLPEGAYEGYALGADLAGHVIAGFDTDAAPNVIYRVYRYWDGSAWRPLTDLVDPAEGWYVGAAYAISNNGRMTGVGGHPPGVPRAYLMTPIAP